MITNFDFTLFRLQRVKGLPRLLVTAFLMVLGIGYLSGAYFAVSTTHFSSEGTRHQFRGNEDVPFDKIDEIKYPKSTEEMLNIVHSHVSSFALIFFSVGIIFYFSSIRGKWKSVFILEPFAATLVVFGGMCLLRYGPPSLSQPGALLMLFAGITTFICFFAMIVISLWEMWFKNNNAQN